MKTVSIYKNRFLLLMLNLLATGIVYAQDTKKLDVDVNVDKSSGSTWYAQPWMWIVGGAVFILLLVALLRGGQKSST